MSGSVTEMMSVTQHLNENSSYNRNNNKNIIFNTNYPFCGVRENLMYMML